MSVPKPNLTIFSDHPPREGDDKPKRKHRKKIKPATTQVKSAPEPGAVFSWQDPYPVDRRKESTRIYIDLIAKLQEHPGKWALVFICHSDKRRHALTRRGCEVTSRTRTDGMREIYARWPEQ